MIHGLPRLVALSAACVGAAWACASPPVAGTPARVAPAADAQEARAARNTPDAVRVLELTQNRKSGVVSAWLSNGVRLHYRRIDQPPGQVQVAIAVLGSEMLETAETRGRSALAAAAMDEWTLSAPEAVRVGAEARDVHIDAMAGPDALQLRVWGSAADMEIALRAAAELLTRPHIDDAVLARARAALGTEIAKRDADSRAIASGAMTGAIFPPNDPRVPPVTLDGINRHGAADVSAWLALHTQIHGSPIEVAIVGDLTLAEALRLAETGLGAIPDRPRVSPGALAAQRTVPHPPGPIVRVVDAGVTPEWSTVLVGAFGPDVRRTAEQRTLRAAARVLGQRVAARLAADAIPVRPGSIGANLSLSAYTGMGLFFVSADTPASAPDAAPRAIAAIEDEIARLVTHPPTEAELAPVREALGKVVQTFDRDARYWAGLLARADSLGINTDDVAEGVAFYSALTPEQISAGVKALWVPANRVSITVNPKPAE